MNDHLALIEKFYIAFQTLDYRTMAECYHSDATFQDAVFGPLNVEETRAMWEMLCRNAREFSLDVVDFSADEKKGRCQFVASYQFSKTGRRVVNPIIAHFEFKEGKIWREHDQFDLWHWSRQAFGVAGALLGWSSFFQNKIRSEAKKNLDRFIERK